MACLSCVRGEPPPIRRTIRTHRPVKPTSVAQTAHRSNRILLALAAAWIALSLALGGTVTAQTAPDAADTTVTTRLDQ
jgi:hypothetical protein